VEAVKGGKERLVITEIPYTMIGNNIAKFLNDIAALIETKKTTDIVDISNQSSKEGIRIVLELRKGADVENLKNLLYKKTKLEDTFGVNILAVADGRPETLGLRRVLEHYVDFQYELAGRKYKTLLNRELEKKEIQEGLIKACDVIDLIIEILRGSKNVKDAKACLTNGITTNIKFRHKESEEDAKKLRFTERQTQAILEMRLQKLIGLEVEALIREHEETLKKIALYMDILDNHKTMTKVLLKEMDGYKKEYSRPRRTVIENAAAAVYEEKKIEEAPVVFLMDRFGYAKTVDVATYERNKEAADKESRYVVKVMNTGRLVVFTDTGKMHTIKVMDVPYGKFRDKGIPIDNYSNFDSATERALSVFALSEILPEKLVFTTKTGMVKIVSGAEFDVAKKTIASTKLADGDEVVSVAILGAAEFVVLQSKAGYFIKLAVSDIPEMKKTAVGNRGIKLGEKDEIESVYVFNKATAPVIIYKEKELVLSSLKVSARNAKGTKK
jgi:DNA gyrase subunit A